MGSLRVPLHGEQYAAVSGQRCIQVYIPDDDSYLPLLAGMLNIPSEPENYEDPDGADAQGVSALWRDAYITGQWERCLAQFYYETLDLWLGDFVVLAGNANVWASLPLQEFGGAWNQSAAAVNDYRNLDFTIPAGTYTLEVHYVKSSIAGKLTISFDGAVLGTTTDMYAAANTYNQKVTFTGISAAGNGSHSIALQVLSKNASSTGYSAFITRCHLVRTGA